MNPLDAYTARKNQAHWQQVLEREEALAAPGRPVRPLFRAELRAQIETLRAGYGGGWLRKSDVLALLDDTP